MSKEVKAIVITGNGTNCETEMAHACKLGGADQVDIVHMSQLVHGEYSLDDYHFLNLPGGFLDGDDLGAGQAGAHRFKHVEVIGTGEKGGGMSPACSFVERLKPLEFERKIFEDIH